MKKSLSIETIFREHPFYDRFRLAREAGFDYVEFGVWTELDLRRIVEMQREYLLNIASIAGDRDRSLTVPGEREEFLEYLSQSIAVARSFSCRNLVIHFNVDEAESNDDANSGFVRIAAATRALLDASKKAERAGVTLLLKPTTANASPRCSLHVAPSAGDVVRVVNSPNLRLLYDVTQMRTMEGDILRAIRNYRDLVGYVQIGDSTTGACEANLSLFRKILVDELAYNGFVGFRFRSDGESESCLARVRDF